MFVGNWDLGTFTQTEGTVSVNEEIRVGAEPTGNGHYNLSGGSVITPLFQVGYDGTGEVTQSGGSVSVGSVLYLGLEASGNGTYRLSGTGTLDVASQLQIGEYGTGVFEMSGGDLTVGSKLFVGLRNTGTGTMTQSGGTVVTPHVNIGYVAGSKGTYQLSGTGTVDVSGQMFVGEYGTADMEVSGGDLSVGSILYLGVRNTGTGTVTQTAGTVTSNEMRIAYTAGSQGTYDLSGPVATSTLDVTGAMYVGYSGTGNFNVDGGKTDVGGDLRVGENSNATGAVVQTGGQVHANRLLLGRVSTANGSYTLSGSASSVTTNGDMWVGHQGDGQFTLDDGALDVGATLFVGYEGTGTFTQNGGSVQAGQLELARSAGKAPADEYVLNSGTLTLDNFARLASWRPGVFTQAGGTVSIGTDLWLTHATATSTADGTYKLQGGELNLTGGQILKGNKPATFEFTGGTLKDVGSIDMTLDQDGGTLAPGATIGTTNILGDYHQAAAGDLQIEINGYGQGTDPGSDYVGVDGNANLDGTLEIVLLDGFMPATGDTFDVVTTTTGSMLLGSTFGLDDSQAGLLPAQYWVATVLPGDKILQLSVGVPEPSTLVLAALGLLGMAFYGWRRKRK
ncbi:MAG: PEP-CTERM sorting domain-containing protein [Planctomycetes bacterium]|nr:PEP-CTERM sorting domain-containing protein [Planctomycetota bacterium]